MTSRFGTLVAGVVLLSACGRVFWFCWCDGMVSFGFLTSTGGPKLAYWRYRAVAPP